MVNFGRNLINGIRTLGRTFAAVGRLLLEAVLGSARLLRDAAVALWRG